MYTPKHFDEARIEVMHELIRARPLATLVTLSPTGLDANHIPLYLKDDGSPFGTLQGHVARANPLSHDFAQELGVLAVFHGPEAYITPSWYATKQETGRAVPTWNYAVVHAHGAMRVIDDPAWLRAHLDALTAHNEAGFPAPWAPGDAPTEYVEKLMTALVGIEIPITKLSGKWKTSQNQPASNRAGVVQGLRQSTHPEAKAMAALIELSSA